MFSTWPKSQDKNLNILRTKKVFKMKQKAFFINFEGLSLKQIKKNLFGRWESNVNSRGKKGFFWHGVRVGPRLRDLNSKYKIGTHTPLKRKMVPEESSSLQIVRENLHFLKKMFSSVLKDDWLVLIFINRRRKLKKDKRK